MKEALLYRKEGDRIVCTACLRYCRLPDKAIGFCGVRQRIGDKLFLLNYGKVIAANIDPIEKKPLFHFFPGSQVLSIGTTGCNLACKYCQNWDISQRRRVEGFEFSVEEAIKTALEYNCDGMSYTYNEPTIFIEYAYDVGRIAKKHGLFNTFVSNGYFSLEAIELMKKFLDAITLDFKGNADPEFLKKYAYAFQPEKVYENLVHLKEWDLHVEFTDLVVPKLGDDLNQAEKLLKKIYDEFGENVPIHFLRFFPHYKLINLEPTPLKTLEKHWELAKKIGFKYVYLGNVPGHKYENTYCSECGKILIRRFGFDILEWNLEKNRCKFCGNKIPIRVKDDKKSFVKKKNKGETNFEFL